jgi:hypothetical protein
MRYAVCLLAVATAAGCSRRESGQEAYTAAAKKAVIAVEQAAETYKSHHKVYPPSLEALVTPPEDGSSPLLEVRKTIDPWDRSVVYEPRPGGPPLVYSLGPDPSNRNGRVTSK